MTQTSKSLLAQAEAALAAACHVVPAPRYEQIRYARRTLPLVGWTLADVRPVVVCLATSTHAEAYAPELGERDLLVAAGRAGAIAGLLVEAACPMLQMIFWIDWRVLEGLGQAIEWEDASLMELGTNDPGSGASFDFTKVIESQVQFRRGLTSGPVALPKVGRIL